MEILFPHLVELCHLDEDSVSYCQYVGFVACVAWAMAAAQAITPFLVAQSENATIQNLGLSIICAYGFSLIGYAFVCDSVHSFVVSQVFVILF